MYVCGCIILHLCTSLKDSHCSNKLFNGSITRTINFWRKIPFLCIPLDTPLSLLTETVRSMLALSDLFCEHSQCRWMFDHFNEIQTTQILVLIKHFFLTVGQNNFRHKIPFLKNQYFTKKIFQDRKSTFL